MWKKSLPLTEDEAEAQNEGLGLHHVAAESGRRPRFFNLPYSTHHHRLTVVWEEWITREDGRYLLSELANSPAGKVQLQD